MAITSPGKADPESSPKVTQEAEQPIMPRAEGAMSWISSWNVSSVT